MEFQPIVRVGLVVPVAVSKVAFFGNVFVSLASFGLVLCGVVFVGRKRRWKTGRTLFVIFLLTFASVMIYSFIVEMPKAYASQTDAQLQQEKVYYFYEDHIGKPIAMSEYQDYDGDGNLYFRKTYDSNCQPGESTSEIWRTNFEPFGVDDYSFNSAGIDVGAGEDCHSTLEGWEPPFRFPGQYADPELLEDFVYNHWRFYMPEIGRYTSPEPMGLVELNIFSYAINNSINFFDVDGACPVGNNTKINVTACAPMLGGGGPSLGPSSGRSLYLVPPQYAPYIPPSPSPTMGAGQPIPFMPPPTPGGPGPFLGSVPSPDGFPYLPDPSSINGYPNNVYPIRPDIFAPDPEPIPLEPYEPNCSSRGNGGNHDCTLVRQFRSVQSTYNYCIYECDRPRGGYTEPRKQFAECDRYIDYFPGANWR